MASPSKCRSRPASRCAVSTRRRSARWRPTSARSASPSPTRARACGMQASTCSARPVRRPSDDSWKGCEVVMSYSTKDKQQARARRHYRVRKTVVGSSARPRLAVFRSNKHISAQVIDDRAGKTLAAASTLEKDLKSGATGNIDAAKKVGRLIAERAKAAGVSAVVFDRGGFLYHGRVAAVADAAREAGLEF